MLEGQNARWEMFVQQALELLLSSRLDLRLLEQQGQTVDPQVLERLVRTFHSIGGVSQFFDTLEISVLLECMESILTLWREQPSWIESSSTAALVAAFELLRQSFTPDVSRREPPVLTGQIEILQHILDDAAWKAAHRDLGTTPPFDLRDYPDAVATAVVDGSGLFALLLPLPRPMAEKQRQLSQIREQLAVVGELVASIPQLNGHFELEETSTASAVWLLFSSVLRQDLLVGLTHLPAENVISLSIPETMRGAQVIPRKTSVEATDQANGQLADQNFAELALQIRQSHFEEMLPAPEAEVTLQRVPPAPEVDATFEERMAEMELLALQIRQSHYEDPRYVRLKKPAMIAGLGTVVSLLLLWLWNPLDITKIGEVETRRVVAQNNPHEPQVIQTHQGAVSPDSVPATPVVQETPAVPITPVVQETPEVPVTPVVRETPAVPVTPVVPTTPVVSETLVVASAPSEGQKFSPRLPDHPVADNTSLPPRSTQGTGEKIAHMTQEDLDHLTSISREAPFTAITPPAGMPRGGLQFTRNRDGSGTFSIATLLDHTVSREGESLVLSPNNLPNLRLVLQNSRKKFFMFNFGATGKVTIPPTLWRSFVHEGSGVVTVSHLIDERKGSPLIRDIAAITTGSIVERFGE